MNIDKKLFNVSFYNYEKEVLGNVTVPNKVYIHDVTLREWRTTSWNCF